jgi:hypothetical protein
MKKAPGVVPGALFIYPSEWGCFVHRYDIGVLQVPVSLQLVSPTSADIDLSKAPIEEADVSLQLVSPASGDSIVSPYQKYILQRWDEGCHEALVLFEEIQSQGYKGSYDTVACYTRRIRQSQGLKPRQRYSK